MRDICMQQDPDISRSTEFVQITCCEVGWTTESLQTICRKHFAMKARNHGFWYVNKCLLSRVGKRACLAQFIGFCVVGQNFIAPEWPAAMRNIVARLEVNLVKRHAAATPD